MTRHQATSLRTGKGLDRLVTFLDAVVAIAITLLVLPLVDLVGGDAQHRNLGALLEHDRTQFGAFALSFVVIARLWLVHHRLVEHVVAYDQTFLVLNLAWALTVVVLPFSTQVIADFRTQRLSVGIYIGTIALNSGIVTALTLVVARRPGLRRDGADPGHSGQQESLAATALLLVALVLGVAVRPVGFYALLLLTLAGPLGGLLHRAHDRRRLAR